MSTLLVTGGTGMIGSYCAQRALQDGHRVVLLDVQPDELQVRDALDRGAQVVQADILDREGLQRAIAAQAVDAIVHTAGVLAVGFERDPLLAIRVNVEGSAAVMHAALAAGVRRVVLFSTGMLYSQADLAGVERIAEEREADPTTLYAASKHAAELVGRALARTRGLEFVGLRLGRVFGYGYRRPGATPNPGVHWVNDMVDRVLAGQGGPTTPALGVPDEWVYAADVADAAVRAATTPGLRLEAINVGTGVLWTPRQMVDAFSQASGVAFTYVEPPTPEEAVRAWRMQKPMDLSRAARLLGYQPRYADPVAAIQALLARASQQVAAA